MVGDPFSTCLLTDTSFGSVRMSTSVVFNFTCYLAGLGQLGSSLFTCSDSFVNLLSPFFVTHFSYQHG